jgi:hypothetical protein
MAQSPSRTMMALGLVLCLPLASAFLRLATPEPSVTSRWVYDSGGHHHAACTQGGCPVRP